MRRASYQTLSKAFEVIMMPRKGRVSKKPVVKDRVSSSFKMALDVSEVKTKGPESD